MLHFITTSDGSKTIFNTNIGEHYHSVNGALQESTHVFINNGLRNFFERTKCSEISIIEVGFGSGLNFLLSADYCTANNIKLFYTGIEANPLPLEMIIRTGYDNYVTPAIWDAFCLNYQKSLSDEVQINNLISLENHAFPLLSLAMEEKYDLVYFDAFAVAHQPEMWTEQSLAHISGFLKPGAVFVTYAITGNLKRAMKALGFRIEKLPGAAGKREMLRAEKLNTAD